MSKDNAKFVILQCDCRCCNFVIEKERWKEDGDITYNISIQDSRLDRNVNSIRNRIKNAFKVLFGKAIHHNDIFIQNPKEFEDFVSKLNDLVKDDMES